MNFAEKSVTLNYAVQPISPIDFGMSDDAHRRHFTRALTQTYPQTIIEDTERFKLVRAGSGAVQRIFMLEKPDDRLVYFVECESGNVGFLGGVVTQVSLWRDDTSAVVKGITARVFSILLTEHTTVLSDEQQTDSGRTFWIRRMAEAAADGLRVGLADMAARTVEWRDPKQAYPDWLNEHRQAWSEATAAQKLRFVISRASD